MIINANMPDAMRRAASRAAGVVGQAKERYTAETRTMDQLIADMKADAQAIRLRAKPKATGTAGGSGAPGGPSEQIRNALKGRMTTAQIVEASGHCKDTVRGVLNRDCRRGAATKQTIRGVLYWSKV